MTDSDDWRVTISLAGQAQVEQAQRALSQHEVEEDVRRQLGRTIAVGAGDSQIFLYAGTEIAAMEAEQVARDVLAQHDIQAEFALHRWHRSHGYGYRDLRPGRRRRIQGKSGLCGR